MTQSEIDACWDAFDWASVESSDHYMRFEEEK